MFVISLDACPLVTKATVLRPLVPARRASSKVLRIEDEPIPKSDGGTLNRVLLAIEQDKGEECFTRSFYSN
jgi:hypothetical protein